MQSNWNVLSTYDEMNSNDNAISISKELGISLPIAQILCNRGYDSVDKALCFIDKEDGMFYDPFLLKDMDKAVARIIKAIDDKEKVTIYGDYDVDGVTSVSSLYLYLKSLGLNVDYFIPSRSGDGYGVSNPSIDGIKERGTTLMITVDTGITASSEVEYAKSLGIDVVVTDHHACHVEPPMAIAVVNPKQDDCPYPFKELAGVGVVYKLICAIEIKRNPDIEPISSIIKVSRDYLDLVAIGTIADVMPLIDENRIIVSKGLEIIQSSPRAGITALLDISGSASKNGRKPKITSSSIGYTIAPRINAAGRIDDASLSVEMFVTDSNEKSVKIAEKLCEINSVRQYEENIIVENAFKQIDDNPEYSNQRVIVLSDENWHHGIIGIVASRITDTYGKPSIMISFDQNGGKLSSDVGEGNNKSPEDVGKGSGRSVKGLNLVEALSACSDLLVKFGGHELAAGLSIKRKDLDSFIYKINKYAEDNQIGTKSTLSIDCELSSKELNLKLYDDMLKLEPFGVSNTMPQFIIKNCKIRDKSAIGAGKHTKLLLEVNNQIFTAVYFKKTIDDIDIYNGDLCDIVFTIDKNEFQNQIYLQLLVKDISLSDKQLKEENDEKEKFDSIWNSIIKGENLNREYNINLDRAYFEKVYLFIRSELKLGHNAMSIRKMLNIINYRERKINYCELKLIIKIFQELNILNVVEKSTSNIQDLYEFSYVYNKNKVNLDKSNIYKKVKILAN